MDTVNQQSGATVLQSNEFRLNELLPGQIAAVYVDDEKVAVYNAGGEYFATQDRCTHTGWPLSDGGELSGHQVTCPLHYWCFDVKTGDVVRGMQSLKLRTFRITIDGNIARVVPVAVER